MCTHWLGLKYSGTNLLRIECIIWSSGMPIPITYSACKVERSISLATATSQAGFSSLIRETTFVFIKSKSGQKSSQTKQKTSLWKNAPFCFIPFQICGRFMGIIPCDAVIVYNWEKSSFNTSPQDTCTHPKLMGRSWDSSIFLLPPPDIYFLDLGIKANLSISDAAFNLA